MASPNGKRSRDPEEEEMYLDNFHSHKRYLSEIMASSLNGLTVGDSLTESLMDSPSRDEVTAPYSPMSEDSDEHRFICDLPLSRPTSPGSPHRHQKPICGLSTSTSLNPCPLPNCNLSAIVCSHPRHRRPSDSEGRFPSSPSDMCHTADLRKAALLRSVQMRTQPSGEEQRACSCVKTPDEEVGYRGMDHENEDAFSDASVHEEKFFDVRYSSERN